MEKLVRQICIDSDALIELVLGNEKVSNFIKETEAEWHTTAINIFEIWSERNAKQQNIENLIQGLKKQNLDENAAVKAGEIRRRLKETGDLIEIRDIFIASICIQNNMELLTNNKKHFKRLKKFGLKLI